MKIKDYFGLRNPGGEIGLELEVEGKNLPNFRDTPFWVRVPEGSLRGPENAEYILKFPVERKKVYTALSELYDIMMKNRTIIHDSDRTSVHVHFNMIERKVISTFNTIFTYLIFEKMFINFSGEERKGNLFCLSLEDADDMFLALKRAVKQKDLNIFKTDELRYASLNLKSLPQRGSLEFRSMRGTPDFAEICKWVKILSCIVDYGDSINNPKDILELFSANGPEAFFKAVFKNQFNNLKYPGWETETLSALRNIQLVIYSDEWEGFAPTIEPFYDI